MKPPIPTTILAPLLLFSFCSHHPLETIETILYHPSVVFVGYVNEEYDSLPGNLTWPNTVELLGDTLRMYFRSQNFHVADNIWNGDLLILTLLPNANDSLIGTRNVYLHMARYKDMNYSYDVAPGDSVNLSINSVEMRALALSRTQGSRIDIDNITVIAKALTGNSGLTIDKGRIFGTVN